MNQEASDKLSDAMLILLREKHAIADLADAFSRTGNKPAAAELFAVSRALDEAHELVRAGIGEGIRSMVQRSEEATANMFMAALNVATEIRKQPITS